MNKYNNRTTYINLITFLFMNIQKIRNAKLLFFTYASDTRTRASSHTRGHTGCYASKN